MKYARKLRHYLDTDQEAEAVALCETALSEFPDAGYYRYWLGKLGSRTSGVVTGKTHEVVDGGFRVNLADAIRRAFSSNGYSLVESSLNDLSNEALRSEKQRIVGSLPYKGDIYLPTEKIPLGDQLLGLRRVQQLLSADNKAVSRSRFEELKEQVAKLGKKRIFVIGNGPSLKKTDLSLLKDEITIGFNGIFLHDDFVPTIHIVEDHLVAEDRVEEIHEFNCPVKMYPSYLGYCIRPQENTIFLNHMPRKSFPVDTDFSDKAEEITYTGGTVTYTGLQVAASLGFEEIYLVGVDASYKVENVERSETYGTGVLSSTADDPNHFDPSYFGKGYRWHDPNVNTMLQAYRKVRDYAETRGIKVRNATIGGELEVFPRVDYYGLFESSRVYPRVGILDFTDINQQCATGIVKKNLLSGWSGNALLHFHSKEFAKVSTYQSIPNDCYPSAVSKETLFPALRSLIEYQPNVLYTRPTHDRLLMSVLQVAAAHILNVPYVVHYMDDWVFKVGHQRGQDVGSCFRELMKILFQKAEKVFVISPKMAAELPVEYGFSSQKVVVAHNFIDAQASRHGELEKGDEQAKVVRYFGGLEVDMSLEGVLLLAKAVENLNDSGTPVTLEIYAGQRHLEAHKEAFAEYRHSRLMPAIADYQEYLAKLASSDVNALCYNFDGMSEGYLRYSMANKLPEILGANAPFVCVGSDNIGTVDYLATSGYPFTVTRNDTDQLVQMLQGILRSPAEAAEESVDALANIKEEFSEASNRIAFQSALRRTSAASGSRLSEDEKIRVARLVRQLLENKEIGRTQAMREQASMVLGLIDLPNDMLSTISELVRSHGLDWTVREMAATLPDTSDISGLTDDDQARLIAFSISSLGHERFTSIWKPVVKWLGDKGLRLGA